MATCTNCNDQGWVCENHRDVPWDDGNATCCAKAGSKWGCGAGAPCRKCNASEGPDDPPRMPPGFVEHPATTH